MRDPRRAPPGTEPALTLGSEQGIRAAYTAHGGELYRFALRKLGDEGRACDAIQEVFFRAWRSAATFDPQRGSVRVWLFTIARNVVVDDVRRTRTNPAHLSGDGTLDAPDSGRGEHEDAVMTTWLVEEALRRISPEHRSALVETYLRDRPYAEVAAEHGVPVGTLRSRVFYGLKSLRLALEEMGVTP